MWLRRSPIYRPFLEIWTRFPERSQPTIQLYQEQSRQKSDSRHFLPLAPSSTIILLVSSHGQDLPVMSQREAISTLPMHVPSLLRLVDFSHELVRSLRRIRSSRQYKNSKEPIPFRIRRSQLLVEISKPFLDVSHPSHRLLMMPSHSQPLMDSRSPDKSSLSPLHHLLLLVLFLLLTGIPLTAKLTSHLFQ